MLTTKLEIIWAAATQEQRTNALAQAKTVLENLVHYRAGRYHPDDVERLAAEMLAWKEQQS